MTEPAEATAPSHAYAALTPDLVLSAVEAQGLLPDGRLLALNSYENRVYQLHMDDSSQRVLKVYRPNADGARWTNTQILEEHAFAAELAAEEIPVIAPLALAGGATLFEFGGFRMALFERQAGRAPELDDEATLAWIGRFLGRIHTVGARESFAARERVDPATLGAKPLQFLREHWFGADRAPREATAWIARADEALTAAEQCFASAPDAQQIRLHGDCHLGNVLWTAQGPYFVDLDDARQGPAMQDFWMLTSGTRAQVQQQMLAILDGYSVFREFDLRELVMMEALRTLRMISYAAWLARRWSDPIFQHNFPFFNTSAYWSDHALGLQDQIEAMAAAPLRL